jgi:hypothetical protein
MPGLFARAALVLVLAVLGVPGRSQAQLDAAKHAQALIAGLDYDEARRVLSAADADSPPVALERARLALYQLDCDQAAAIMARPEVQKLPGGEALADVTRGCQRVTASLAVDKDEARAIELRWQDEHDRALAPLVFDTVAHAREALTRDLGVDWPRPTRIVVVRDLLSLSAMTGLPYKSAQTTGTVAVAKWGRVTLLSPRASPHGYPWRDTVAHELTHLAVTRASRDQAPLWLQEGVAKREETRWRDPGPFDDRPSPEAIAQRGSELGMGLPLDKLGPSIAMLPSADAAMVAFAEVTSFVRYYSDTQGEGALPKLMQQLKEGAEPSAALAAASGKDLQAWDKDWRAYLSARARQSPEPLPALFGLGGKGASGDQLRDLRDRSRLADLLLARQHPAEALTELDRIELAHAPSAADAAGRALGDPSIRWLRVRALEALDRRPEGRKAVGEPKEVLSSFGPWWAVRGRLARQDGDDAQATASFWEAVAADPLDPEGACETLDATELPKDPAKAALCQAARTTGTPELGGD